MSVEIIDIIKTGQLSKFKEFLAQEQISENDLRNNNVTTTITSCIAISIQYQKYDIYKYLLDIIIDENVFIDYKIRKISEDFLKMFIYLSIKYYNGSDIFIRYLISDKKVQVPYVSLYISAKLGHFDLVKYFFDNGSIITSKTIDIAASNKHFDIVLFLIGKISNDPSLITTETISNIFSFGPLNLIEYIINIKNINIEKYSVRLLFENNRKDIIVYLISKNILPDVGTYAVRDAYENKHYDLVYFLLKQRFPVDITCDYIIECTNLLKQEGIIVNNVPYY